VPGSRQRIADQSARLTQEERETFITLAAKVRGRRVEVAAIEEGSLETTRFFRMSHATRFCSAIRTLRNGL
jgi:hypothetical protein